VSNDPVQARETALRRLAGGQAMDCFLRMARLHGADVRALEDPRRLPQAAVRGVIRAPGDGWVETVDADAVGRACLLLGAGRRRTDDAIDPSVGVADLVKVGERVESGQRLATVHAAAAEGLDAVGDLLRSAFVLSDRSVDPPPLLGRRWVRPVGGAP
jgi:thymidine phosphorylase